MSIYHANIKGSFWTNNFTDGTSYYVFAPDQSFGTHAQC